MKTFIFLFLLCGLRANTLTVEVYREVDEGDPFGEATAIKREWVAQKVLKITDGKDALTWRSLVTQEVLGNKKASLPFVGELLYIIVSENGKMVGRAIKIAWPERVGFCLVDGARKKDDKLILAEDANSYLVVDKAYVDFVIRSINKVEP